LKLNKDICQHMDEPRIPECCGERRTVWVLITSDACVNGTLGFIWNCLAHDPKYLTELSISTLQFKECRIKVQNKCTSSKIVDLLQ